MATWFTTSFIMLALFPRSPRLAFVRKLHCAWCWKTLHLMQWYPRRWSSTICGHHGRQLRAQSAARRARPRSHGHDTCPG